MVMRCGLLALQGGFAAHAAVVRSLGHDVVLIRTPADLAGLHCLILPGGESTTINRLLAIDDLGPTVASLINGGLPTLGTCCGLILIARGVNPPQATFGLLDVDVERNAYGRQLASTVVQLTQHELGGAAALEGVFIRAPRVTRVGPAVRVLASRDGDPVLVAAGALLGATFHPELTTDRRVHQRLLALAEEAHG
jgi:5'-phosphate synthase pdxT subunit